jgi:ubiquinone/menaquinone biosynthesis C-methylase UbiE
MSNSKLPESVAERIAWVIDDVDQKELRRRYDLWAAHYDADVDSGEVYGAPMVMAEVAGKFLSKTDRILDAGAGTGLSGAALKAVGFENLTAIDYSAGMLEVAAKKGIYRETMHADLGAVTPLAENSFDAVTTVGTTSQMPAHSLKEFVRVVRPEGHIVFCLWPTAYLERGYSAIQQGFEAEGRLAVIYKSEPFLPLPTTEPDLVNEVWVFEVLS